MDTPRTAVDEPFHQYGHWFCESVGNFRGFVSRAQSIAIRSLQKLELPHVVIPSLRRPPGTSARAVGSPEDCWYGVSLACGWMENCILRNVTTHGGTCVTSARYQVPLRVAHVVSIHPPTLLPPDNATIRLHEWIHAMVGLLFVQKKDFFFFLLFHCHIS